MAFFTIITATSNAERFLPRLLRSLEAQTCRDFELIIQDNASEDGTLPIFEAWRARLPKLSLVSEKDTGIYDAWNRALSRITGTWVIFLGADDRLESPDTLTNCKEALKQCSAAYAVGGVTLSDEHGCPRSFMPGSIKDVAAGLPRGYAPFWQNGLFYHVRLFAGQCFDSRWRIFGDYDFLCRTWSDQDAVHLPFPVSRITLGGVSNAPGGILPARLEAWRISKRHFGVLRSLPALVAVAKSLIVRGLLAVLGESRSVWLLNRFRMWRGLDPAWCGSREPRHSRDSQTRPLCRGYLYHNRFAVLLCRITDAALRLWPRRKRRLPQSTARILLVKPDHLGDMLLAGSVIPALQHHFPQARIDLIAGSWVRPVASILPGIAHIHWLDHWMHNRGPISLFSKLLTFSNGYIRVLWAVRQRKYDLCLCLRSYGGNLISLGALGRVGFLAGHGTGGLGPLLDGEATWEEGRHEVEHFMEVLTLCGIPPVPWHELHYPELVAGDTERYQAARRQLGLEHDPFTVICPCSGQASRMFPPKYWRKLIAETPGMRFVLCVGPEEATQAQAIAEGLGNVSVTAPALRVQELLLLMRDASHIHAVDSFGAHLAGASGTKTTVHCRPGEAPVHQFRPLGTNTRCVVVEHKPGEEES